MINSSTPLATEQAIDRLLQSAGGRIVACNIVAGLEEGLIEPSWTSDVLAAMHEVGAHDRYAEPGQFVRALDDLRTHELPPGQALSSPHDIRLGGVDSPVPFDVEVSWILPARRLEGLMLSEDRERLVGEGLMWRDATDPVLTLTIDQWKSKPPEFRTARLNPTSYLGRKDDVVWFTRRDALKEALTADDIGGSTLAQRTRDLLGLTRHGPGTLLAAMHFQPSTLASFVSARPTFADAGSHARFKTWPDRPAARKQRNWGRTVDLRALTEDHQSLDGCPERIMKSMYGGMFANEAMFEFELLGTVQTPVDQTDAADMAFARKLWKGRKISQLGATLKAALANT